MIRYKPRTIVRAVTALTLRNQGKTFQEIRVELGLKGKEEARMLYAKGMSIQRILDAQRLKLS